MFLNCGQVLRGEDGVWIEIWEGTETYTSRLAREGLVRLLRDETLVPVGRMFGLLTNPNYGRAALVGPEGCPHGFPGAGSGTGTVDSTRRPGSGARTSRCSRRGARAWRRGQNGRKRGRRFGRAR